LFVSEGFDNFKEEEMFVLAIGRRLEGIDKPSYHKIGLDWQNVHVNIDEHGIATYLKK